MLIRQAELQPGTIVDVRIDSDRIGATGTGLAPRPGETTLDAAGAALLPGLHDHHLHLCALAVSLESLRCGPPDVMDEAQLVRHLRERAARDAPGDGGWIRGIGYHESVAGDIDRAWLDRAVPDRPARIQHRSGRLWIFNSSGLARLARDDRPPGSELPRDGRLYDADRWLQQRLGSRPPPLRQASILLASHGVTGITDATARNSQAEFRHFADCAARAELLQHVVVMGDAALDAAVDIGRVRRGPTKLYLREAALPALDALCASIARSHEAGRAVAVHCVTEAEVVFAAGAIGTAGVRTGDRIEHASVAPPAVVELLATHGLAVVTQPNFVRERGDAYLAEVHGRDQPWLYRLRGFLEAGIALAGSTDTPLGEPNPWLAMQAAVDRRTLLGRALGEGEAISPEDALALFCGDPLFPGRGPAPAGAGPAPRPAVGPGSPADLCLLDRPWSVARADLAAVRVVTTIRDGELIWRRG